MRAVRSTTETSGLGVINIKSVNSMESRWDARGDTEGHSGELACDRLEPSVAGSVEMTAWCEPLSEGMTFQCQWLSRTICFYCQIARTLPTALAAPVDEGMMLAPAPRPPRQSFLEGPRRKIGIREAFLKVKIHYSPSTVF